MRIRSLLSLAAVLVLPLPAAAQTYLPVSQAVALLADGKQWSVTTSEGRTAKMMLNKDGTGKFDGSISMSISWKAKGEDMCIDLGMMLGTKCLRFRSASSGFEGFRADKLDITFAR